MLGTAAVPHSTYCCCFCLNLGALQVAFCIVTAEAAAPENKPPKKPAAVRSGDSAALAFGRLSIEKEAPRRLLLAAPETKPPKKPAAVRSGDSAALAFGRLTIDHKP
jgi:hypothetical protein